LAFCLYLAHRNTSPGLRVCYLTA